MIFCQKCNAQNMNTANFCVNCNNPIQNVVAPDGQMNNPNQQMAVQQTGMPSMDVQPQMPMDGMQQGAIQPQMPQGQPMQDPNMGMPPMGQQVPMGMQPMQQYPGMPQQGYNNSESFFKKNLNLIAIAGGAIIVAVVAYFIFFCGGSSYNALVQNYCKAMNNFDANRMLSLYPPFQRDHYKEEMTELMDMLKDSMPSFSLKCSIDSKTEIAASRLEGFVEDFKEDYGFEGSISRGYEIKINLEIEVEGQKQETSETEYIIQIGNKWYFRY